MHAVVSGQIDEISAMLCTVLTGVVGTLAKLAKTITLRITTNKLYFILSERLINGGVGIWCEMLQVSHQLVSTVLFSVMLGLMCFLPREA